MKKVFYISLCIFVLIGIFLLAYNFVFRSNSSNPIADPTKIKESGDDQDLAPQESGLVNPVNEEILGGTIGSDGSLYYYSLSDKSFKKSTLEGKNKSILLSNLPGFIERVVWSPDKSRVLMLIKNATGNRVWHFADLSTKTLTPLRMEMSRLAWNNLGDKIFYQFTDPKTGMRSLNIANPDGSEWKKLADLGKTDTYIAPIPKSTFISLWSRPNALENTTLETISLSGSDRKSILMDKKGADYLWSPTGETILASTSADGTLDLATMNKNGGEYRTLAIPTLVSKVVWGRNGDTLYFALPGSLPDSALLPNDYWSKPLYTQDTFWKMDLATGKKMRIVDLEKVTQSFDSTDLVLTPNEDALFFTDRKTHRLYRIDL